MKTLAIGLISAFALTGAVQAQEAEKSSGLYVAGTASLVHQINSEVRGFAATGRGGVNGNGDVAFKTGYGGSLALGYAVWSGMGMGVRVEAEGSYRSVELDELHVDSFAFGAGPSRIGTPSADLRGDVSTIAGMANVAVDFVNDSNVTPYVLVGFGAARTSVDVDRLAGFSVDASDNDWGYAGQAGLGFAFQLTDSISATLDYRYFHVLEDTRFTVAGASVDVENRSHSVGVGARFRF